MLNPFSDPKLITDYHQEYLKLINIFDSAKRPGIFIRYFNINYDMTVKKSDVDSTFEIYNRSGIIFDIYDLTPTYNFGPVVNATTFASDKIGQMFEGVGSIVVYTIKTPRINDLVTFYDPIRSEEIFRVNNFRAVINSSNSVPSVNWYELDLEMAPIVNTENLKIFKHYVYDIPTKKYLVYNDYVTKVEKIEEINRVIDLLNKHYSKVSDLYKVRDLVPLVVNKVIFDFKNIFFSDQNYSRIFDELYKPYNYMYLNDGIDVEEELETGNLTVFNLASNEYSEYVLDFTDSEDDLYDIINLIKNLYTLMKDPIFAK